MSLLFCLQIGPLLGHTTPAEPLAASLKIPEFFSSLEYAAAILGLMTMAIVFLIPRFIPKLNKLLPSPLLALIVGTAYYMLMMDKNATPILGTIPTGLPLPQLPVIMIDYLPSMIESALVLAALGSIDSLLTSLVADNVTRTYHKSDRELIGQGIGNTISGLFGGLPGAGATMRTVVNVKAGGLTPLSGVLHAIVLLVIVLGAGDFASHIPKAVLAGILVKVGTDIIDWDYLKKIRTAPLAGVSVMLVVLGMTVFVDLIMAVATGMMMVSLIFLKRMTDLQLESFTVVTCENTELPLNENERDIMCDAGGRILLYSFGGPMMFGSAKGMIKQLANYHDYDVLVLDMSNVPAVDFTSCKALSEIVHDAKALDREVLLIGTKSPCYKTLQKQKVLDLIPEENRFADRESALTWSSEHVKNTGFIED